MEINFSEDFTCKMATQDFSTSAVYRRWFFLAVAEAEGEGGKTSALEVEAEGEADGLVFCI